VLEPRTVPSVDTVAGFVSAALDPQEASFVLRTAAGVDYRIEVNQTTSAELLRNLDAPYVDASDHLESMLVNGRYVLVTGISYPREAGEDIFEAKHIVFLGRQPGEYNFEQSNWWVDELNAIAKFYRRAQFGDGPVDFKEYRTVLRLGGDKTDSHVQETDTISRLVYGMASAFMLTGNEQYLEIAEAGTQYLRDHMKFVDTDNDVVYWYHGVRIDGERERKLLTSEFDDDRDAVPMYEQIYALAGPTQTFRITGDPRILADVDGTLRLFDKFFLDREGGGYYSHVDPILLSPHHESLGANASRKNWNSVGDHAPAYLINLLLATGEDRHRQMLERTFDTIVEHFPDPDASPFVNERFHTDWSSDHNHGWQQDRAVVGHNLKIAWNLMRMQSAVSKDSYEELATHLADSMPAVGSDLQRGGWYDVMERSLRPGELWHRLAWHDRKAWWQQEQAILAYLILHGVLGGDDYLQEARRASAFYNTYFLDHDEGAVYFNVLSNGFPYLLGTERFKGSHSMSMYHSAELCYLGAVYTNLLIQNEPMSLWFRPRPEASRILRVAPDLLPPGRVRLTSVQIDGKPYEVFDPYDMTVELPESETPLTVQVELTPVLPASANSPERS
jgi:mannose/cellobiose epimerase-like protein (N-acyl-D-glucosamine 2-epimerase family)